MELHQKVEEALKAAIREKNETAKDALRMLLTSLKVKEKEIKRRPVESEIQQIIANLVKQRRDSAEQFRTGAREDLAVKEENEIGVLEGFLPPQLSIEELEKLVEEAVSRSGASSLKDMGRVMKLLMPEVSGRADGKVVNELVRAKLG
ncbi:MAG: GatB/YqeY domain-containing protein [Syntrophobacteraceae bacterium]|nr:GatB/YqeY domain-containing protein [Syntrophobacteraceae bacterium]